MQIEQKDYSDKTMIFPYKYLIANLSLEIVQKLKLFKIILAFKK